MTDLEKLQSLLNYFGIEFTYYEFRDTSSVVIDKTTKNVFNSGGHTAEFIFKNYDEFSHLEMY